LKRRAGEGRAGVEEKAALKRVAGLERAWLEGAGLEGRAGLKMGAGEEWKVGMMMGDSLKRRAGEGRAEVKERAGLERAWL